MSSNLAERIANDLMAANMLCGPATVVGVGHLIEKLLAAHEAQQVKDEYKAIQTAIDIMLKGNPGAAQNAVREDYPELARIVDKWKAQQADCNLADRKGQPVFAAVTGHAPPKKENDMEHAYMTLEQAKVNAKLAEEHEAQQAERIAEESRSVQRRKALQRGEPMPTFTSADKQIAVMRDALQDVVNYFWSPECSPPILKEGDVEEHVRAAIRPAPDRKGAT